MNIQVLELYTPNLARQVHFYASVLGLDILEQETAWATFKIGHSSLKLSQRAEFVPYHYAINIPSNQEKLALEWLKKRLDILKDGDSEIQYFDFWDAHAIYYVDADGNIGELIARKSLKNNSKQKFSAASLLEISEIGLPTLDIAKEYNILHKTTGIPIYSGSLERFCALGDERGLFIIINKHLKKEWYPSKEIPQSADFNIKFSQNGQEYTFEYKDEQLSSSRDTSAFNPHYI